MPLQNLAPYHPGCNRIVAEKCSFKYIDEGYVWKTLVDKADARMLTTAAAGGFVGATVGPHVRIDP